MKASIEDTPTVSLSKHIIADEVEKGLCIQQNERFKTNPYTVTSKIKHDALIDTAQLHHEQTRH